MALPKIAFIGTGGTIASLGRWSARLTGLRRHRQRHHARRGDRCKMAGGAPRVADVIPVKYRNIPSTAIDFADWKALAVLCRQLPQEHPGLDGIVIGHGFPQLLRGNDALTF